MGAHFLAERRHAWRAGKCGRQSRRTILEQPCNLACLVVSDANVLMNYDITIKLSVVSPENAERIEKRLRAILEFGTIREVIGDALDLENDHHLIDVVVTPENRAEAR